MQRSRGQDKPTREERRYVGSEQMCEDEDMRRNITSITLVTLYPLARWQRPMYSLDIVLVTASKSPWSIEGDPRARSTVGEGRDRGRRGGEGRVGVGLDSSEEGASRVDVTPVCDFRWVGIGWGKGGRKILRPGIDILFRWTTR
jgi:hypothetical protein